MSISLLLMPLALAGVAAVAGKASRNATDRNVCEVRTRMRDVDLLTAALRETGATAEATKDGLLAQWEGITARFERGEDGIWSAHFTGEVTQDRAIEIVQGIDAAYGRQVQQAVLARLRERAPSAGLRLQSEDVTTDDEVRLVFTVERAS
jgi:hypothetical protein